MKKPQCCNRDTEESSEAGNITTRSRECVHMLTDSTDWCSSSNLSILSGVEPNPGGPTSAPTNESYRCASSPTNTTNSSDTCAMRPFIVKVVTVSTSEKKTIICRDCFIQLLITKRASSQDEMLFLSTCFYHSIEFAAKLSGRLGLDTSRIASEIKGYCQHEVA